MGTNGVGINLVDHKLPEDVMVAIFSKLPPTFLGQWMESSRYWNMMIRAPYFIDLHVQAASEACENVFVMRIQPLMYRFIGVETPQSYTQVAPERYLPYKVLRCSFRGLFLVYDTRKKFILRYSIWNPLTDKRWVIPDIPFGIEKQVQNGVPDILCYDAIAYELKFLSICQDVAAHCALYIYSWVTHGWTRRDVTCVDLNATRFMLPGYNLKECVYWMIEVGNDPKILKFNSHSELLELWSLEGVKKEQHEHLCLSTRKGEMLLCHSKADSIRFYTKEGNGWTLLMNIPYEGPLIQHTWFINGGRDLIASPFGKIGGLKMLTWGTMTFQKITCIRYFTGDLVRHVKTLYFPPT